MISLLLENAGTSRPCRPYYSLLSVIGSSHGRLRGLGAPGVQHSRPRFRSVASSWIDTVRKRAIIRTVDTWGARDIMAKSHLKLVDTNHRKSNSCHAGPQTQCRIADQGVSDRAEVESLIRGREGQSLRSPRRRDDPGGLSARPQGKRVDGPALGPDRFQPGHAGRP